MQSSPKKRKTQRDVRMYDEKEKEKNNTTEKCEDDQSNEENSPSRKS